MTVTRMKLAVYNADTSIFKKVHDAILATGIVQTSDTGQLDMTTPPTYNSLSGNNYGYTVYRFNDAAQSVTPIYFSIIWQNAQITNASHFKFNVIVGTGSNGTGTITGIQQASRLINMGAGSTSGGLDTQLYTVIVSGDGSSLAIAYAWDTLVAMSATPDPRMFFFIDRFRDSSGAPKTTGYVFQYAGSTSSNVLIGHYSTTYGYSTYTITDSGIQSGALPAFHPWIGAASSESVGGAFQCYPIWLMLPSIEYIKAGICVPTQDFPSLGTFEVTHLGAKHTYITIGAGTTRVYCGYGNRTTVTGTLAVLCE
jgi:hypothetical protein